MLVELIPWILDSSDRGPLSQSLAWIHLKLSLVLRQLHIISRFTTRLKFGVITNEHLASRNIFAIFNKLPRKTPKFQMNEMKLLTFQALDEAVLHRVDELRLGRLLRNHRVPSAEA